MVKRSRTSNIHSMTDEELDENIRDQQNKLKNRNDDLNGLRKSKGGDPWGDSGVRTSKQLRDGARYVLDELLRERRRRDDLKKEEANKMSPMMAAIAEAKKQGMLQGQSQNENSSGHQVPLQQTTPASSSTAVPAASEAGALDVSALAAAYGQSNAAFINPLSSQVVYPLVSTTQTMGALAGMAAYPVLALGPLNGASAPFAGTSAMPVPLAAMGAVPLIQNHLAAPGCESGRAQLIETGAVAVPLASTSTAPRIQEESSALGVAAPAGVATVTANPCAAPVVGEGTSLPAAFQKLKQKQQQQQLAGR